MGSSWDYGRAGRRGGPGLGLAALLAITALGGLVMAGVMRRRRMGRSSSRGSLGSAMKARRRSAHH